MAQVVECLPSKEAVSSTHCNIPKKKNYLHTLTTLFISRKKPLAWFQLPFYDVIFFILKWISEINLKLLSSKIFSFLSHAISFISKDIIILCNVAPVNYLSSLENIGHEYFMVSRHICHNCKTKLFQSLDPNLGSFFV
jgi:hypothetical protein